MHCITLTTSISCYLHCNWEAVTQLLESYDHRMMSLLLIWWYEPQIKFWPELVMVKERLIGPEFYSSFDLQTSWWRCRAAPPYIHYIWYSSSFILSLSWSGRSINMEQLVRWRIIAIEPHLWTHMMSRSVADVWARGAIDIISGAHGNDENHRKHWFRHLESLSIACRLNYPKE